MSAAAQSATYLTRTQERALALTIAVVTANAYYIHPIIGEVARGFGVGEGGRGRKGCGEGKAGGHGLCLQD